MAATFSFSYGSSKSSSSGSSESSGSESSSSGSSASYGSSASGSGSEPSGSGSGGSAGCSCDCIRVSVTPTGGQTYTRELYPDPDCNYRQGTVAIGRIPPGDEWVVIVGGITYSMSNPGSNNGPCPAEGGYYSPGNGYVEISKCGSSSSSDSGSGSSDSGSPGPCQEETVICLRYTTDNGVTFTEHTLTGSLNGGLFTGDGWTVQWTDTHGWRTGGPIVMAQTGSDDRCSPAGTYVNDFILNTYAIVTIGACGSSSSSSSDSSSGSSSGGSSFSGGSGSGSGFSFSGGSGSGSVFSGSGSASFGSGSGGCNCAAYTLGHDYGGGTWRQAATLSGGATVATGGGAAPVTADAWYLFPRTSGGVTATGVVEFEACGIASFTYAIYLDADQSSGSFDINVYVDGATTPAVTQAGPSSATRDPEGAPPGGGLVTGRNYFTGTVALNGACISQVRITGAASNALLDPPANTMLRFDITGVTYL